MYKCVGNVRPGNFTGGATGRGHWWVSFRIEKDGGQKFINVDLTACQFYTTLKKRFMGDPVLLPLKVSFDGCESGESKDVTGIHYENPDEYQSTSVVIEAFKTMPSLATDTSKAYKKLKMKN